MAALNVPLCSRSKYAPNSSGRTLASIPRPAKVCAMIWLAAIQSVQPAGTLMSNEIACPLGSVSLAPCLWNPALASIFCAATTSYCAGALLMLLSIQLGHRPLSPVMCAAGS